MDFQKAGFPGCEYPTDNPHTVWWGAFKDKTEPVGFACMSPSLQFHRAGYLARSYVNPLHRGHRLQQRLIMARERQAIRNGWNLLVTTTITENPASSNNLIKCGFEIFYPPRLWGYKYTIYWKKGLVMPDKEPDEDGIATLIGGKYPAV